jgi:hypothetical protein
MVCRPIPPSTVASIGRPFGVALFGVHVFNTIASQPHYSGAKWYSALETKVAAATLFLENVVFLQSGKRV